MASSSTYGTIADSKKNDFDKFMEDMNAIVGKDEYGGQSGSGSDSNTFKRSILPPSKEPAPKDGGSSGGTKTIATNPDYSGIKDLAKLRTDTALKGQQDRLDSAERLKRMDIDGDRYKLDRTLDLEKTKLRYDRNDARNKRFERSAARRDAKSQADKDRRSRERQANAGRSVDLAALNNQANARNKEFALQSRKINAEIAALNNANKWKELEAMSTLASTVSDREFRKQQLEQQKQTAAWNTVGAIFS